MRRGGDSNAMRPSYRSTTSMSSAANGPGTPAGGNSNGTILVNLDVFIQRATVGHDISPLDEDLIVLFRRNSKEITSEPTRWHSDHVAEWNQHVGIQTSLLRGKKPVPTHMNANGTYPNEFLKKEYEVVLVALPSHSAVALFTVDFAELVQPQNPVRHKVYRISPLKCRDLAALLEFEIVWDYAKPPPQSMQLPPSMPSMSSMPSSSLPQSSGMMGMGMGMNNTNQNNPVSIAGMPSSSLLSTMKQRQNGYPETSSSISSRRTTASMSSQNSDRDPLADLAGCSECRSSKRRLERKEMQILQLETFLKESQKRIDSLIFENEELIIREQAETKNAGQYRAMTIRLLQELEMAFQFCATQVMQAQDSGADMSTSFMFLPQFEFMERVKRFHFELDALAGMDEEGEMNHAGFKNVQDAWKLFDFRSEMDTALERNQRLQRQLEFLSHSLLYDVQDSTVPPPSSYQNNGGAAFNNKAGGFSHGMPQLRRTNTQTSADTSGGDSDNSLNDSLAMSRAAPVFTMTEQINNLERENFVLKAKLESALLDVQQYQKVNPHSETYDTTSSSSHGTNTMHDDDSLQIELEEVREVKSLLEQEKNMLQQDKSVLEHELSGARTEIEKLLRQLEQNTNNLANSQSSVSAMAPPPYPFDSQQQQSSFDASAPGSERGSTAAPGFLNKIYMDVGKAKIALEEKVKQLNVLLREATDDNLRLQAQLEAQQELLMKQQQDLEINSEHNGPKIVELDNDYNEVDKMKIADLEKQIQQFHRQLDESYKKLAGKEQELAALSASIAGREVATAAIGSAKKDAEKELEVTLMMLMKAQDQTTELEGQVKMLQQQLQAAEQRAKTAEATAAAAPITPPSVPSSPSSLLSNGGDRGDEVMELTKQLKLSKQEVMQLRYRSNQMESVNEKLEEALKEKRTLQVKLTALEGQLYDHRSRTISDNSFASDQNVMVAELQKQLDQRSAQLLISQRELEMLRREIATRPTPAISTADASYSVSSSASSNTDAEELSAKVKKFEAEISRLCDCNDDQARKINELGDRIMQVTQERVELEGICMQMVQEMDLMAHLNGNRGKSNAENDNDSDEYDLEELEEKAPAPASFAPVSVAVPAMITTTKVTDRYASALASNDRRPSAARDANNTPAIPAATGTQSKVAHLIKNFTDSNETSSSSFGSNGRRPSDPASNVKKVTKIDFRLRNGSNASARGASTSTGSAVEAMAARFQAGIGSSSSRD